MPTSQNFWLQIAILALILFCSPEPARSVNGQPVDTDKFCVHSEVFVQDQPRPILEEETVFDGTQVYDTVTTDPAGIISKFDLNARVVRLIDRTNEIRTTVSFEEIGDFHAKASAIAIERKGLFGFLAQPKFIYEFEPAEETIRLKSEWITYEAVGKPAPVDLVVRFADFADWSKRLATMLHQGSPARARVELNKKLRNQNWRVVEVTLRGERRAGQLGVVRSVHDYRFAFDATDRNFIQGVEKDLKAFDEVSFSEFRAKRNIKRLAAKK